MNAQQIQTTVMVMRHAPTPLVLLSALVTVDILEMEYHAQVDLLLTCIGKLDWLLSK